MGKRAIEGGFNLLLAVFLAAAQQSGMMDGWPDWVLGLLWVVILLGAVYLTCAFVHERRSAILVGRPMVSLLAFVIIGALIGAVFGVVAWNAIASKARRTSEPGETATAPTKRSPIDSLPPRPLAKESIRDSPPAQPIHQTPPLGKRLKAEIVAINSEMDAWYEQSRDRAPQMIVIVPQMTQADINAQSERGTKFWTHAMDKEFRPTFEKRLLTLKDRLQTCGFDVSSVDRRLRMIQDRTMPTRHMAITMLIFDLSELENKIPEDATYPAPPTSKPRAERVPATSNSVRSPNRDPIDDLIARRVEARRKAEAAAKASAPRIPAGATPDELIEHYKRGATTSQSQKRIEPYIGKWVTAKGRFTDLTSRGSNVQMKLESGNLLSAQFDDIWKDRLESLVPGDEIGIGGKLSFVVPHSVALEGCELA